MSRKSSMHVGGESDGCVVPMKCQSNGGQPPAEGMEGRRPAKENIVQATAPRTQSRISELSDLSGVRKIAREKKRTQFTALLHHVTVGSLRDSSYVLKRDATPGVDGLTWKEYETELEPRLSELYSRVHLGTHRAWERIGRSLQREPIYRQPMGGRDL
jgi:RNA-directed DNA polymerase